MTSDKLHMRGTVDRDRRPLPIQVRDALADMIRLEGLRPGDRLPTEEQLAAHFQVGRTTMREALRRLEERGLIKAQRGSGRWIAPAAAVQVHRPITRFESVTEMMRSLGYQVTNRVIGVEEGMASGEEAEALAIVEGASVIRLVRLRIADGDPVIYSVNVLSREVLPGTLDDLEWNGSITELLAHHGHHVISSAARISATSLPEDAVNLFPEHASDPWLLITETNVTDAGLHILFAKDYHRGDIFSFEVVRRRE